MKKFNLILAIVAMFFMSTVNVNAQNVEEQSEIENAAVKANDDYNPKHEVYASVGMWGFTETANGFGSFFGKLCKSKNQESGTFVNFNAGYGYHITKKLITGINVSYARTAYSLENSEEARANDGKSVEDHVSFLPYIKYNWINKPHFVLYSKVAAGARLEIGKQDFGNQTEGFTRTRFTYQVSPIGIEAGGMHVRAFSEIGWGQSGVIQAGVRVLF